MTDIIQAKQALYDRFVTLWPPNLYAALDNEVAEPPGGDDSRGLPWARAVVRHLGAGPDTMGAPSLRRYRDVGALFVQVFVPAGSAGTSLADPLVKGLMRGLRCSTFPGTTIKMMQVSNTEQGEDKDHRWWGSTVQANFDYDQRY